MGETIYDPRDLSTTPATQTYDPRDLSSTVSGQGSPPEQRGRSPQPGFLSRNWPTILNLPIQAADWLTTPVTETPPVLAGVGRGVRDVIDTGAHGLAWTANQIPGVNVDLDSLRANDAAERAAYEKQYGGSTQANLARVGGQLLGTHVAGRALGLGAVAPLLSRAGTVIAPEIGAAARFLTGTTPATSTLGRAAQLAVTGAGTGALQSGLTSAGYDDPLSDQIAAGAATGAIAGPVIGGLTKAFDATRGYVGGIRPEVADLADIGRQYGVTPPMTALTNNPNLKMVTDALQKLPFSGSDAGALAKQRQLQSAIADTMGSGGNTFGPATMREAATRLSNGYNTLFANAPPVRGGPALTSDIADVGADAARYLVGDQAGAMAHVGNAMQEVRKAFARGGELDPQAYKSLMGADDGVLARIEDAAPSAAQPYLQRIRDAVTARFAASAGPEAADTLRGLDSQYRAMKTIQPLAEKSTLGDINPGALLQQVINQSRKYDSSNSGIAYTGGGPLGDLGRVGKQFFGHIPDSGTAARLQAYELARNPVSTLAMTIPGVALGRPMKAWINSPTVAGRAIDAARGGPVPDIGRAVPAGLLGALDYLRGGPTIPEDNQ